MHTLFRDIGMHASLGRAIEQIGGNRFWKQLILLLRQHLPFDNALAIFYPANGVPVALEEYDAEPHAGPASMLAYLNGLYLLDPFYQACREGLASGLYRLEEIAPDHFRQSEYYLSYFHDNVLEDEVQFILQVPGQGALSLSLGMQRIFTDEECGMLGLLFELGPGADAAALAAAQPAPVAGRTAGRDGHADTRRPQPLRRQRAIGTRAGDRSPDPSRLLVEGHGRAPGDLAGDDQGPSAPPVR